MTERTQWILLFSVASFAVSLTTILLMAEALRRITACLLLVRVRPPVAISVDGGEGDKAEIIASIESGNRRIRVQLQSNHDEIDAELRPINQQTSWLVNRFDRFLKFDQPPPPPPAGPGNKERAPNQ